MEIIHTQTRIFMEFAGLARQIAEDFRNDSMQHQIVALWLKGSRVLGYGVNQRRHAKAMSYFNDSLHAEKDLLRRFGTRIRGAKIFLYRFNNAHGSPVANKPLCARPCHLCSHSLREAGVNRVVYITDDGVVESIRGHELALLTEDPSVLTRMFLERAGNGSHGKFIAEGYLLNQ